MAITIDFNGETRKELEAVVMQVVKERNQFLCERNALAQELYRLRQKYGEKDVPTVYVDYSKNPYV